MKLSLLMLSLAMMVAASPQYRPSPPPPYAPDPIPIVQQSSDISPDGSYAWSYDTANGITAEESGEVKNAGNEDLEAMVAQGSYSYTSPEGVLVQMQYIADENGFQPIKNLEYARRGKRVQ